MDEILQRVLETEKEAERKVAEAEREAEKILQNARREVAEMQEKLHEKLNAELDELIRNEIDAAEQEKSERLQAAAVQADDWMSKMRARTDAAIEHTVARLAFPETAAQE